MAEGIIAILIFIVAGVLVFKFVKGAFKLVFSIVGILGLLFVVGGYFVYTDAQELGRAMQEEEKILLYVDEGIVVAAAKIPENENDEYIYEDGQVLYDERESISDMLVFVVGKELFSGEIDSYTLLTEFGEGMQDGPLFILSGLRNGSIEIYPEYLIVKVIKYVPEGMFNNALKMIEAEIHENAG